MSAKTLPIPRRFQFTRSWSLRGSSQSNTTASMLLVDLVAMSITFALSVFGRHLITRSYPLTSFLQFIPCMIAVLIGLWFQGLYPGVLIHPAEEMRRIFSAVTAVFLLMTCATFLWRTAEIYSRSVFLATWAAGCPMILIGRQVARQILCKQSWWGVSALILGAGPSAQRVAKTLMTGKRGIRVTGVLSDTDHTETWHSENPPLVGKISSAPLFAKTRLAQYAIVAMPQDSRLEWRNTIQDHCRGFGHVILMPDIPGLCSLGVSVREIGGEVGLEMPQRLFHLVSAFAKRALDLLLSCSALIVLSPLFIGLTIAVRLSSPGPVFFGQNRCGKNNRSFKALKFRTMVSDADQKLRTYLRAHPECLGEWQSDHKLKCDPRVTSMGRWMRRLSLDELPQLLNVLFGDMSLVGPRPIVDDEVVKYGRCFSLYNRVRPGITGLWQVSGRNNTTYDERVKFDEFYVNNWSVWLDIYILIRTVKAVITTDGAF